MFIKLANKSHDNQRENELEFQVDAGRSNAAAEDFSRSLRSCSINKRIRKF